MNCDKPDTKARKPALTGSLKNKKMWHPYNFDRKCVTTR